MDAVIFDLGDVLFEWSPSAATSALPRESIRKLFTSDIWYKYETAHLTESEVYHRLSTHLETSEAAIRSALAIMRDSLRSTSQMFDTVRVLKENGVKVYAMSNVSQPDWEFLKTKATTEEWDLFSATFPSWQVQLRKPDRGFYETVLKEIGADPLRTVFVDDKAVNVVAAEELGMVGVIFSDPTSATEQLFGLCNVQRSQLDRDSR